MKFLIVLLLIVSCTHKQPAPSVVVNPPVTPPAPPSQVVKSYSTMGNQILENGKPIRLLGINWFGAETETLCPHGLWVRTYKSYLDQIKSLGFNTIRLPFSNDLLVPGAMPQGGVDYAINPDLRGLTGLQIFDKVIAYAGQIGLYVILDRHRPTKAGQSGSWATAEVPESKWISDWVGLAKRYSVHQQVIGFDLHNEPHGVVWRDWVGAANKAASSIHNVNPNLLIIVEGVDHFEDPQAPNYGWTWWGGNLAGVRNDPVRSKNVVYSPHEYPQSVYNQPWFSAVSYPANLPVIWDYFWGYIHKGGTAPIFLGEFGTKLETTQDEKWIRELCKYTKQQSLSFAFWSLNPNSGDTGGLLSDDWKTVNQAKLSVLKSCF